MAHSPSPERISTGSLRTVWPLLLIGLLLGGALGSGTTLLLLQPQQQRAAQAAEQQQQTLTARLATQEALAQAAEQQQQTLTERLATQESATEEAQQQLAAMETVVYNIEPFPAVLLQRAPQADCQLRSTDDSTQTTLVFRNLSEQIVLINWLNYEGQEEAYHRLQPGQAIVQATYATHPWCIRNEDNAILWALTARDEPNLVEIR